MFAWMDSSGLVLDFYDDAHGELFRELFPTREEIPEVVKEAHALSPAERQALPDDVFALVLMDGGQKTRKYACVDPGNTTLAIDYFLKTAHKLPVEAQKVAAQSLLTACGWYDLQPPEDLEKIALLGFVAKRMVSNPIGTLQTAITAPAVAKGVGNEMKARNMVVQGQGGVVTPEQVQHALGRGKHAEVTGTPDAPLSAPELSKKQPDKPVVKTANLQPHVEVSQLEAPIVVHRKVAHFYALGDKYPLDDYRQVKTAAAYFDEYSPQFTPEERREFCTNLVKRAESMEIPLSDTVRKYGSDSFAPHEEVKVAFNARRTLLDDQVQIGVLNQLERICCEMYKEASPYKDNVDPETACTALSEFDKQNGLHFLYDRDVPDPFYSVFGFQKEASDEDYSWLEANDYVTGNQLIELAKSFKSIRGNFGEDFAKEFQKDPVGVFKSMPTPQKKVLARMAQDPPKPVVLATY